MGEVIDRATILAFVEVPPAIMGQILGAFVLHLDRGAIHRGGVDIVVPPTDVPLAAHEGLIARYLESLRHQVLRQTESLLIAHTRAQRIATGEQASASERADRRGIELLQSNAIRAEPVHIRRLHLHLTGSGVIPDVGPALVICEDDQDVRSSRCRDRERERLRCNATSAVGDFDRRRKRALSRSRPADHACTTQGDAARQGA